MTRRPILLAGISACLLLPLFGRAAESVAVPSSRVTATLVTDTDTIQPGKPFHAGLRLQLAKTWHTYWKNPGDAGVAPELAWDLPPGTAASPITWPAPTRVAEGDLTTFAYQGDVLLPVTLTPGTAPLDLKAHASWLVCRDLCVPEEGDFTLHLEAGAAAPSAQAGLFVAAAARTPRPASFQATVAPDGTLRLSGTGLPQAVTSAEFFPAAEGQTETAGVQVPSGSDGGLAFHVDLGQSYAAKPGPVDGVVAFTLPGGAATAFDVTAMPVVGGSPGRVLSSLPLLLLAALAGGLLLNLMPCVFPVLAMKAMALSRLSGANRRTIRMEAGSYTAGVVTTFVALGATLLAIRSAGGAVGWGFQFQSPLFVTVVAWVLFATGLNMSGVFALGGRMAGAGQSLASLRGHLGSFFTGLLAVIVATPCTAAFMGAAVAGAMDAPPIAALSIFATMGVGLALPYLAVALLPGLAACLPRPGPWMVTLRQALAFPMYGAAAWLVWVVSQQTGPTGVLTVAVGLVGIGFAGWALGVAQLSAGWGRRCAFGAAWVAALSVVALVTLPAGASEPSEPFSPARLAELQGQGRPVFVNMTAAWCLSCLLNERVALAPASVRQAFADAHVAYLKGDWTRRDPVVSSFLRDHDRDGVPLYVFYAPGKPPVVLPQILSESTLLAQVAKLRS